MEFKEVVNFLLKHKFVVVLANEPVLTTEFAEKFKEVDLPTLRKVKHKDPNKYSLLEKREIWDKFIQEAVIPFRVNTPTGRYTVRTYAPAAVNQLIIILAGLTEEEYKLFVAATNNYYRTIDYPITLSKFLINGEWKGEMEEMRKNKGQGVTGTNKFES